MKVNWLNLGAIFISCLCSVQAHAQPRQRCFDLSGRWNNHFEGVRPFLQDFGNWGRGCTPFRSRVIDHPATEFEFEIVGRNRPNQINAVLFRRLRAANCVDSFDVTYTPQANQDVTVEYWQITQDCKDVAFQGYVRGVMRR